MKKNIRQIIAIVALIAILSLIVIFFLSAIFASPDNSNNNFMGILFGIITIPILAWILIFCISAFQNKHTMTSLFPENFFKNIFEKENNSDNIKK